MSTALTWSGFWRNWMSYSFWSWCYDTAILGDNVARRGLAALLEKLLSKQK
jgi:hypothetical protein